MTGNKIIEIMQKVGATQLSETTDLLYGEVISTSPLSLKIDNRFIITENFIILSALCKEKTITITHDTSGAEVVILWRGIIVGDKLRLIRLGRGQKFYAIEREGGLTI